MLLIKILLREPWIVDLKLSSCYSTYFVLPSEDIKIILSYSYSTSLISFFI